MPQYSSLGNRARLHHKKKNKIKNEAAIKKTEIVSFAATWKQLETIYPKQINTGKGKQIAHALTYKWELHIGYTWTQRWDPQTLDYERGQRGVG